MAHRLDVHEYLCELARTRHVYYSPPEDLRMQYPAVVYSIAAVDPDFADNQPYRVSNKYTVTVIDEDPDSEIVERFKHIPGCRWNRMYKADDLYHDVFTLSTN